MKLTTHLLCALAVLVLTNVPAFAQISLTTTPYASGSAYIPDVLGGDATAMHPVSNVPLVNQGLEYDLWQALPGGDPDLPAVNSSARREAMNSIPFLFDWAIWDPSGRGDDHPERPHVQGRVTTTGGPLGDGGPLGNYHSGEQVEWASMFSAPVSWGIDSADGLGADLFLTTGAATPASSNTTWRSTDGSGLLGLDLDGSDFTLTALLPDGIFDVSLIVRDNGPNNSGTATFGTDVVAIGSANGLIASNNAIHTLRVTNTTGAAQGLTVVWGGAAQGGTNARIAGVVVQQVPEPGSGLLLVLGGLSLLATRRRK